MTNPKIPVPWVSTFGTTIKCEIKEGLIKRLLMTGNVTKSRPVKECRKGMETLKIRESLGLKGNTFRTESLFTGRKDGYICRDGCDRGRRAV